MGRSCAHHATRPIALMVGNSGSWFSRLLEPAHLSLDGLGFPRAPATMIQAPRELGRTTAARGFDFEAGGKRDWNRLSWCNFITSASLRMNSAWK
jgi:hypothetical protein